VSKNGEPLIKPPQGELIDAARVTAMQQNMQMQSQLLVNRALSDASNLANALEFLTQQAQAGQPQARQVLTLLFANLDAARAASAGIVLAKP
jgi:hypothetical protein